MKRDGGHGPHEQERSSLAMATGDIWSTVVLGAGYLFLYLVLDRVSFVQPLYGISITPWNPPPGISLALLIVSGLRWIPFVAITAFLSDFFLITVPVSPLVILTASVVVAGGYGAAAFVLRDLLKIDFRFSLARDLVLLIAVVVVASGLVALGFVATYAAAGIVPWNKFGPSALQYWIGDAIGIVVFTPPLLLLVGCSEDLLSFAGTQRWWHWLETLAQYLTIALALAIIFGFGHRRHSFELFYLLFLPLVWIAVRRGFGGTSLAVLVIQFGLIGTVELQSRTAPTVRTFQILMLALALTGLLLGAVVTERGRVARALVRNERRLGAILNTARDGMLLIDVRGRIESVNPAVERMFGRPADLLIGHSARELFKDLDSLDRLGQVSQQTITPFASQELNACRADGTIFPVEVTAGAFGTSDDKHYTLVVRDVTVRRETETHAREHQAELAHIGRLTLAGEMASALAHELNQPLTAIAAYGRGCLRLLRGSPLNADLIREGVMQLVQQAERAGDVIGRLREFMRPGTSQRSAMDVKALVNGALILTRVEAAHHGIEIQVRIDDDLPPIFADRVQIEQVLVNLVRNAMDAVLDTASARRIIIVGASRSAPGSVRISVADTGGGVAEHVAAQLFQPFVTTKPSGMGMGLSISRSIIEAHDGRLDLMQSKNSENGGAVFAFELPVIDERPASSAEDAAGRRRSSS